LTPRPHFRAVETEAEDDVPLNQTMALRGPLWSETVKTRGHFFFSGKTTTARKRLYVFVTPVEPPPAKEGK
jgi:hypothetical protein